MTKRKRCRDPPLLALYHRGTNELHAARKTPAAGAFEFECWSRDGVIDLAEYRPLGGPCRVTGRGATRSGAMDEMLDKLLTEHPHEVDLVILANFHDTRDLDWFQVRRYEEHKGLSDSPARSFTHIVLPGELWKEYEAWTFFQRYQRR